LKKKKHEGKGAGKKKWQRVESRVYTEKKKK